MESQKITLLSNPNRSHSPTNVSPLCPPQPLMIPGTDIPACTPQNNEGPNEPEIEEIDYLLVTALNDPGHRFFIFKLDLELAHFLQDTSIQLLEFPPMSTFQRLIVHHVASYFKLGHNVGGSASHPRRPVFLHKTPESQIPVLRLSDFVAQEETAPKKVKILLRNRSSDKNESVTPPKPQIQIATNPQRYQKRKKVVVSDFPQPEPEVVLTKEQNKKWTQREIDYAKARARIFNEPFDEEKMVREMQNMTQTTSEDQSPSLETKPQEKKDRGTELSENTNTDVLDSLELLSLNPPQAAKLPGDSFSSHNQNPLQNIPDQLTSLPTNSASGLDQADQSGVSAKSIRANSDPSLVNHPHHAMPNVHAPTREQNPSGGPWNVIPTFPTHSHGHVSPEPYINWNTQRANEPYNYPYSHQGNFPHGGRAIPMNMNPYANLGPQYPPYVPPQYPGQQMYPSPYSRVEPYRNDYTWHSNIRRTGKPVLYNFSEAIPGSPVEPVRCVPSHILEIGNLPATVHHNDPHLVEICNSGATIKILGPNCPILAVYKVTNSAKDALARFGNNRVYCLRPWSGRLKNPQ